MSQYQEQKQAEQIVSRPISQSIKEYVRLVTQSNKTTGKEYLSRLKQFEDYCISTYNHNLDDLLISKTFQIDVYKLLNDYVSYLIDKNSYSNLTIKQRVVTARNLLEYYDIEVSPRKFKFKVRIPKSITREKEALTREFIIEILENCPNPRLKIFVLWLAATGMRAGEACSIRMGDLDFNSRKVFIKGEYTKMKVDRWVFLTSELIQYLRSWFEYKYRVRKKYYSWDNNKKYYAKLEKPITFTPVKSKNDFIFGLKFGNFKRRDELDDEDEDQSIKGIYSHLLAQFNKVLDRLGVGYEDGAKRRRTITLHSFRRYVKSTISDFGYSDFSEWVIGHKRSTYYRKSEKEKFELFKKLEPSLTYLDQTGLKKKHADVLSRLELMENENLSLQRIIRDREEREKQTQSMNHDSMIALSEQLLKMQKEIEELKKERKETG